MTRRDRTVLAVVAGFALILAYWFLALSPKHDDASKLAGQVDNAKQDLVAARSDVAASRVAKTTYAVNYTSVAQLGKAVPADDEVDTLVFQLDSAAKADHSDFRNIKLSANGVQAASSVTAAQAVAATSDQNKQPGSAAANATGATGVTGVTGTTGASAATATTGAAAAAPAIAASQSQTAGLPPGAVVGPAGLLTMPFTFDFQGSFSNLAHFFNRVDHFTIPRAGGKLESYGRLITVDGILLRGWPKMQATISANTFLLPADQGLFNGATQSAPAQGSTLAVSSTGGAGSAGAPAVAATATGVAG